MPLRTSGDVCVRWTGDSTANMAEAALHVLDTPSTAEAILATIGASSGKTLSQLNSTLSEDDRFRRASRTTWGLRSWGITEYAGITHAIGTYIDARGGNADATCRTRKADLGDWNRKGRTVATLTVADLAGVVYSSGKVFNGLSTGRLDTENFLRSGSLDGVASRADLALLEDLRDAAQFVIDNAGRKIDSKFVRSVNSTITRSGALHPGQLRMQEQSIGVATPYGRHIPDALTEAGLQALLDDAMRRGDVQEKALELFVDLSKAQPFEDGNKRTAVFVANSLLIGSSAGVLFTIPVDDNDPNLARTFNDLLARAYIYGEGDGVKALLRSRGLT